MTSIDAKMNIEFDQKHMLQRLGMIMNISERDYQMYSKMKRMCEVNVGYQTCDLGKIKEANEEEQRLLQL